MWFVLLLTFGVQLVHAEHHSLQYFYTGTGGLPDFPEFVAVGIVDGKQIDYYDSIIGKNVLKQAWMEGTRDENRITDIRRGHQTTFAASVKIVSDRFNKTTGIHTWQQMYGCSWDDETRDVDGFDEFGYDGEDFVSLDLKNLRYVSTLPEGVITQEKWNKDKAFLESKKQYRAQICIEWLKKYLDYGKSSLHREVSPQVSLLQKDPSSPVMCHATGFYPEQVVISWLKNDQEHHEDEDIGELVPNEDGTFQKSSILRVKPEEWKQNQFSCVVEHKGKTIKMILTEVKIWTNHENVPIGIIVGVIAAVVLLIIAGVVGFKIYQKKKGFKPVRGSDDGSTSSAHTDPNA